MDAPDETQVVNSAFHMDMLADFRALDPLQHVVVLTWLAPEAHGVDFGLTTDHDAPGFGADGRLHREAD